MTTDTKPTANGKPTAKQRTKPERKLRLLVKPTDDFPGLLFIGMDKAEFYYLVKPLQTDYGRAFRLSKIGTGDEYDVMTLGGLEDSCECLGFLRWGHCKHHDAIKKLLGLGLL